MTDVDEFFEDHVSEDHAQDLLDAWVKDMEDNEVEGSLKLNSGKTQEDWANYKVNGAMGFA